MLKVRMTILFLSFGLFYSCNTSYEQVDTKTPLNTNSSLSVTGTTNTPNAIKVPLLSSFDYGQTWVDASQNLPKALQVSFMEQYENEIIIASDNMGLFLSTDNIQTWNQIGDKLPNPKINALFVNHNDIYVGVFRKGIFKSSDQGKNWTSLNHDLKDLNIQSIWQYENTLLIGTDIGIFHLDKSNNKWIPTNISTQVLSIYDYDDMLVAGTSQGTVLSKDKGKNWKWIRKEGAVHYTHNIGKTIFEFVLNGDLYYSDDWGSNWTASPYYPRAGSYIYELIQVDKYFLMSNNYGIHRSADRGKTWQLVYPIETIGFFDFLVKDGVIYGGTRIWDEFRGRD